MQLVNMSLTIQENISYYINDRGHVVMCMLDVSQDLDRVNLLTLFQKMTEECVLYI